MKKLFTAIAITFTISGVAVGQDIQNNPGSNHGNKFEQLGTIMPTPNEQRTASGAPGNKYWQQRADYDIKCSLDEKDLKLSGAETITYYNNSPDPLDYLWLQLDENQHNNFNNANYQSSTTMPKVGGSASLERAIIADKDNGYGDNILSLTDALGKNISYTINRTMMRIDLPAPLKPGEHFVFNIKWNYKISDRLTIGGRGGYEYFPADGNYLFTMTQWYPRLCVYSDFQGWQNNQFTGRGEFALTFGNFKVQMTVPADHVVGGTGECINYANVLSATELARYNKAKSSEVPVYAPTTHRAFDAATAEIERIEAMMTTWRPDSDLSKVNAAAGKTKVQVDPETFAVVKEALHTSAISGGTFDITFESLHGLWKFDQDLDPHPPTAAQVKAKLPLVGYKHVKLDEAAHTIFIDQVGTKISLGGIAKGYAVDHAAKILDDAGLTAFYVQAGGDLFARGKKPDGTAWQAGIRDPRGPDGSYFAMIDLSDHAFSTAGDYERAYIESGKRYHHIIDPHTGFPATASRSVTIYADNAYQADAIDDAVFILGPKKGIELVESIEGMGVVIVDDKNNLWVSKRLQGKVKLLRAPTAGL